MDNFTDNLTAGNVKAAMKDAGAVSADLWQVAPDRLRVLEGFNARVKNDAYTARVRFAAVFFSMCPSSRTRLSHFRLNSCFQIAGVTACS